MADGYCPYCGAEAAADFSFCSSCGKDLPGAIPEEPSEEIVVPTPRRLNSVGEARSASQRLPGEDAASWSYYGLPGVIKTN